MKPESEVGRKARYLLLFTVSNIHDDKSIYLPNLISAFHCMEFFIINCYSPSCIVLAENLKQILNCYIPTVLQYMLYLITCKCDMITAILIFI